MNVVELMQKAKDSVDIHQVFGEPYQVGDVTIIPVARAGGGGGGSSAATAHGGEGYGFGIQPTGVYAIKGDTVKWVPVVNVNSIINGAFVIAVVAIWRAPRIFKAAGKAFG
jgi:uncharacterized spore protein YtfJ